MSMPGQAGSSDIRLDPGAVLTHGWYAVERFDNRSIRWTQRRFGWRQPGRGGFRMKIWYWLPEHPGVPALEATVFAGADRVRGFRLTAGWNVGFFDLPKSEALHRDCTVELSDSWVPADCGVSGDVRDLGIMIESVETHGPIPRRRHQRALDRIGEEMGRLRARFRQNPPASGELAALRRDVESLRTLVENEVPADRYVALEERLRGSRELVRERQGPYAALFAGRWNVLDVGCGRGEFLEALAETGGGGWGIDSNRGLIEDCQRRGLRALEGDALEYLATLPEGSLEGIFCAQVVEHLRPAARFDLLHLCHRSLAPGAPLVVETPNPKNLSVGADSFWFDPTHRAPIPAELLGFELEQVGFELTELRLASPTEEAGQLPAVPGSPALEPWRERLNDLLFGARDYAFIARRPGKRIRPVA